jgi:hypothetical protein|tara:strand:+ start:60 stop:188 length:129 start_codon:yes stop_codon:yes gene_type:complete
MKIKEYRERKEVLNKQTKKDLIELIIEMEETLNLWAKRNGGK